MKVKQGQLLKITQPRRKPKSGLCIATADFDTDEVEFYPVKNALPYVSGLSTAWSYGEDLPSRKGIDMLFPMTNEEIEHELTSILNELQFDPYDETLREMKTDLEKAQQINHAYQV